MIKFLARRLVQMAILFVIFLSIVWLLLQAMPGDITNTMVGDPNVTPEMRQQVRERLGLDRPLHEQYVTYLTNFFRGEMGISFSRYPRDVSSVIFSALPRTLVLFLSATLFAFWLGFKTGKIVAWRRGAKTEQALVVGGVFLQTVFYPWFGIVMLWVFAFYLGWFPIGRFQDPNLWRGAPYDGTVVFGLMILSAFVVAVLYYLARFMLRRLATSYTVELRLRRALAVVAVGGLIGFWYLQTDVRPYVWDMVHHTILPVLTLGLVAFGATMLLTRSSMLETLGEDYILTARAKGLGEKVIRDRHAARNALLPVTTSLVLALATVIGGGIITEYIFSWPGMGKLLLDSIVVSDVPLAAGVLAITGVLALVGHLVADLLYGVLDPRIRIT